ncbi:MAG: OmpA family protein [Saprospiraceae bacterium]|nr:OmpA family protein [Saprospiraceae bacterium]
MKRLLLFFIIIITYNQLSAQTSTYTDHKPSYRKWQDDYILDKIAYTADRTIFYFRFVCKSGKYTNAIFYPPGGEHPWYLKGRNVKKNFYLKELKYIRRNGKLMKSRVRSSAYSVSALEGIGYTVFSCEVHFERLPNDVTTVDLIEGKGQEYNKNHFNCFNVKLKTWKDKDLGTNKDSEDKVNEFQEKYGVKIKNKEAEEAKKIAEKKAREEAKRKAEEKRLAEEAEAKKIAEEAEAKRLAEEAEAKRLAEEAEAKRLAEEKEFPYSVSRLNSEKDIICDKMLVLDKIKFHDNSTKYKGMIAAKRTIYMIFNYMKEHPKSTLMLYGHTDIFGPKEFNMELSKARVLKIQRWLSMYGIKPYRINYEWYGPNKPLDPKGNPINRRVEIKVKCS